MAATKPRDLVVTRTFAASAERVWNAWTIGADVQEWWGPTHFTCPHASMDVRPGGTSLVAMRSPAEFMGGRDFYNTWTYRQVVPQRRLEYVLDWADAQGNRVDPQTMGLPPDMPRDVRHVVTFADNAGRCDVKITEYGYTSAQHYEMSKLGLEQCLDKMAALLARQIHSRSTTMQKTGDLKVEAHGEREIRMTRTFSAPRRLVFDAWTKPDLLKRWLFGPKGWTLAVVEIDLRVGGKYRFVQKHDDGREMGWGGTYTEVKSPERFAATERFDESWYPGDSLNTVVLTEKDGKTVMVSTMTYESRAARDGVLASPMEEGLRPGFDRMDALVQELAAQKR